MLPPCVFRNVTAAFQLTRNHPLRVSKSIPFDSRFTSLTIPPFSPDCNHIFMKKFWTRRIPPLFAPAPAAKKPPGLDIRRRVWYTLFIKGRSCCKAVGPSFRSFHLLTVRMQPGGQFAFVDSMYARIIRHTRKRNTFIRISLTPFLGSDQPPFSCSSALSIFYQIPIYLTSPLLFRQRA